jgi:hypothetical protein
VVASLPISSSSIVTAMFISFFEGQMFHVG